MDIQSLIIGISGQPRSGKDTVAGMVMAHFPEFHRTTYSSAISEKYDKIHGTNTLNDEEEKVEHRHGLAELANRESEKDSEYLNRKVLAHPTPLLVTGVRRLPEAEGIRRKGGVLIFVTSSQEIVAARMGKHFHNPSHHVAEHHLDDFTDWDFVIENTGTLKELEEKVALVVQQIVLR